LSIFDIFKSYLIPSTTHEKTGDLMTFPTFPSPKKHLAALAQALNDGKRPA
jgi:hypothetical protein